MIPDEHLPSTGLVYRPTVTEGSPDWIGPNYPDTPTATIMCLLSGLPDRDEQIPIGQFDARRMLLFAKPDADIQAEDRVVIDNISWKIFGAVVVWKNPAEAWADHHAECTLIEEDI